MLVHDLYVVGVSFAPPKADSPLVVDPDAMLPCAFPREFLEAIARRYTQIIQLLCGVKYRQLSPSHTMQVRRESSGDSA